MGHELRTPLQVILILCSKLAKSTQLSGSDLKALASIRANAGRMSRLVSDLLDFTSGNLSTGIKVEPRPVDLHDLCAEALVDLRHAHPNRALVHERSGDGQGLFDPDRLIQVLVNLVTNALKYGRPDAPVLIRTKGVDEEVLLEVHNEGDAIAPEAQLYLFDPFRRISTESLRSSLGLGLAIVKTIVCAHGGVVDVQSTNEVGTTFMVYLPREPLSPTSERDSAQSR